MIHHTEPHTHITTTTTCKLNAQNEERIIRCEEHNNHIAPSSYCAHEGIDIFCLLPLLYSSDYSVVPTAIHNLLSRCRHRATIPRPPFIPPDVPRAFRARFPLLPLLEGPTGD